MSARLMVSRFRGPIAPTAIRGFRTFSTTLRANLTFKDIANTRAASTEQAWEVFDSLPPVAISDMVGFKWKGYEVDNGHPWVGKLEENNWFGKLFPDENNGDALLIYANEEQDGETYPADAIKMFGSVNTGEGGPILYKNRDFFEAEGSISRLKTILHRGVNTASMFYDNLPVNDTFRKVDDNTLLGVMDAKFLPDPPYFFVLEKYSKL